MLSRVRPLEACVNSTVMRCGKVPMSAQKISKVVHYCALDLDGTSVAEVREQLGALAEDHGDDATFSCEGGTDVEIYLRVRRDETPAEVARRERHEAYDRQRREAQYRMLAAEFGHSLSRGTLAMLVTLAEAGASGSAASPSKEEAEEVIALAREALAKAP